MEKYMIAASDVVLIVAATALLGFGLFRWQSNVEQASFARQTATIPSQASQNSNSTISNTQGSSNEGQISASDEGVSNNDNSDQVTSSQTSTSVSEQVQDQSSDSTTSSSTGDNGVSAEGNDNPSAATEQALATYEVEAGDSLSTIASRFNTTVSELREINDIQGSLINIGQLLRYPLPANP